MSIPARPAPTIVLVDDEPDIRIILRRLVAMVADGIDLVVVEDGAEALAVIRARPVALLITDYSMRGLNGLQLARAVKAVSPTTTVVVTSAYATHELAHHVAAAGADAFVPKPFPFDRLEAIVREALA
jgi:DNA-binding NtrC family response regulator